MNSGRGQSKLLSSLLKLCVARNTYNKKLVEYIISIYFRQQTNILAVNDQEY